MKKKTEKPAYVTSFHEDNAEENLLAAMKTLKEAQRSLNELYYNPNVERRPKWFTLQQVSDALACALAAYDTLMEMRK